MENVIYPVWEKYNSPNKFEKWKEKCMLAVSRLYLFVLGTVPEFGLSIVRFFKHIHILQ